MVKGISPFHCIVDACLQVIIPRANRYIAMARAGKSPTLMSSFSLIPMTVMCNNTVAPSFSYSTRSFDRSGVRGMGTPV